jgi:hypothetical protein
MYDYRSYPEKSRDGEPKPSHVYDYPDIQVGTNDVVNTLGMIVIDRKEAMCNRLDAAKLYLAYACSLKAAQLIDV